MKCTLRKWKLEDAAALAAIADNPRVTENLRDGFPHPYTVADGEDWIKGALSAPEDSQFTWAIDVDGVLAGSIGIFRGQNVHRRTAELGYFLGEQYWGCGLMTEATREACRLVFSSTDIVRIFADPFAFNRASCRVLEKAGFQHEGTLRQHVFKGGRIVDAEMYSCIRE